MTPGTAWSREIGLTAVLEQSGGCGVVAGVLDMDVPDTVLELDAIDAMLSYGVRTLLVHVGDQHLDELPTPISDQ